MKILRQKLRGSPFVGVFCCLSEKIGLFPLDCHSKEIKGLGETLGIEIIKAKLAESSLLGILAVGNSKGFVVGEIATDSEIKELEASGIKIKKLSGITAIGNLLAANDSKGMCSAIIKNKIQKQVEQFLKIDLKTGKISESDLIGSSMVATNKGFIMNANATEQEFLKVKKIFGLSGAMTTANFGDEFVGNSVVANSKGTIAGEHTSGSELMRIDEGLHG